MKTLAVICEYNPFHTGHAHHIAAAKAQCDADFVLGLMSGFFVQRAEPAVVSPQVRAHAAVTCGMDGVIELPVLFSCAAGKTFAEGAVRILSRIPSVRYLAMGTEDDGRILQEFACVQSEEPPAFKSELAATLDAGQPYAVAVTRATAACSSLPAEKCAEILHKPNNILAMEYLKAIDKFHAPVTPIFVPRQGNDYHSTDANGTYISASAARKLLYEKKYDALRPYIPAPVFDTLVRACTRFPVNETLYGALTVHALRQGIPDIPDGGEGLAQKLAACAREYASLDAVLNAAKSKRYTLARVKRAALQTLLGITNEAMRLSPYAAARLLAVKESRKDALAELRGVAVRNEDYAALGENTQTVAKTDAEAGSVYALITGQDGNPFWERKLLTVPDADPI